MPKTFRSAASHPERLISCVLQHVAASHPERLISSTLQLPKCKEEKHVAASHPEKLIPEHFCLAWLLEVVLAVLPVVVEPEHANHPSAKS